MSDTVHETLIRPITFSTDMDSRTAKLSIAGIVESTGDPIKNSFDGNEHRVSIQCPEGIEFDTAEIGNSTTSATGVVKLDFTNTYGQFNKLDHSGTGPAHKQ
jgi:hypothetical protein